MTLIDVEDLCTGGIFLRVVFVMIFETKIQAKNRFSLHFYHGLRPLLPIFAT
jgi:hypothetical protein